MKNVRKPLLRAAPMGAFPLLLICAAAQAQTPPPAPVETPPAAVAPEAAPAAEAAEPADSAAAPAAAADESLIEEIVVTSQKRAESIQDVPISVSALAGALLENSAIDTQQSLPQITPNLQVSNTANFTSPYLRGVGTQYANPGLESSVATYFDDQYMPRADANQYSFGDIERIEVLKGPQGTLYGRNATGGAIRIITKDPTDKFEGKVVGTYGRFDRMGLDGVLNTPLREGLNNRLVVRYDTNDGYVKAVGAGQPNMQDRNQFIVRDKILWQPSEVLKVKLTVDYGEKADHEGQAFINLFEDSRQTGTLLGAGISPGFYKANINIPANDSNEQKLYGKSSGAVLRVDYETEVATLSSISGYRRISFSGIADLDGTNAPIVTAVTDGTATRNYTEELQAVSRGDGPLSWVGGIYYLKEEGFYDFGIQLPGANPGDPYDFVGGKAEIAAYSLAPYAQLTYEFNPVWEATLGMRYTSETKKLLGNRLYAGTVEPGYYGLSKDQRGYYASSEADEVSFNVFSPKAVLSYKPRKGILIYGSVSKGFKSGGYNTPAPTSTTVDRVDPEHITAYELGWKTDFSRVRFNGAVFHYDYQDLQVSSTDTQGGGGITAVRNGAEATIDGVEIDVTFAAGHGLEFGIGGGWLDATFDEFMGQHYTPNPAGGFTAAGADLSGRDLPLAPEFSGYARASYTRSLDALGTMVFNTVYAYTGDYNYEVDGTIGEDSRGLLSATLGWMSPDDRYEAALYGTNLTDEKYFQGKTLFPSTGGWGVPAAPVEYGIKLTYNF